MSLQKDVQNIIISVMKYTNVSTRFHNLNIQNKINHLNNYKHTIMFGLIHYFEENEKNKH